VVTHVPDEHSETEVAPWRSLQASSQDSALGTGRLCVSWPTDRAGALCPVTDEFSCLGYRYATCENCHERDLNGHTT
jgi:hypothetical protein